MSFPSQTVLLRDAKVLDCGHSSKTKTHCAALHANKKVTPQVGSTKCPHALPFVCLSACVLLSSLVDVEMSMIQAENGANVQEGAHHPEVFLNHPVLAGVPHRLVIDEGWLGWPMFF